MIQHKSPCSAGTTAETLVAERGEKMRQLIGLLMIAAFSLTGGCGAGEEEIVCGPGTVELDGVCIPGGNSQAQSESDMTCKPGTVEIDGECVSDSRVGNDNNGNPSSNGNPVNGGGDDAGTQSGDNGGNSFRPRGRRLQSRRQDVCNAFPGRRSRGNESEMRP